MPANGGFGGFGGFGPNPRVPGAQSPSWFDDALDSPLDTNGYSKPWAGDAVYNRPFANQTERQGYLEQHRPPAGSADADIFQFEKAWEPRFSGMGGTGGGSMVSLQGDQRGDWGNYQWQAPERSQQGLQADLRDATNRWQAAQRNRAMAPAEREAAQRQFSYAQQALSQFTRGGAQRDQGRFADPRFLTEQFKPWYSGWYMPRDYSKGVS